MLREVDASQYELGMPTLGLDLCAQLAKMLQLIKVAPSLIYHH